MSRTFEVSSEAEMAQFAKEFAEACRGGILVALSGTLGAGKTFFVREVASRLGADREVVLSPTFTLCNEYSSTPKIYHLDLYRIRDEDEYYGLGVEEMCNADSIVFVEWADRFADALPPQRLNLHIDLASETGRIVHLDANGDSSQQVLDTIR